MEYEDTLISKLNDFVTSLDVPKIYGAENQWHSSLGGAVVDISFLLLNFCTSFIVIFRVLFLKSLPIKRYPWRTTADSITKK